MLPIKQDALSATNDLNDGIIWTYPGAWSFMRESLCAVKISHQVDIGNTRNSRSPGKRAEPVQMQDAPVLQP